VVKTAAVTAVVIWAGPLLVSLSVPGWNSAPLVAAAGYATRIPEAVETAEREQRRVTSERVAFERFAAEIRELDATNAGATVQGSFLHDPAVPAGDSTDAVRDLYRDIVMSVDHYEADYDESLETNLTAELGPDLATAVTTTDTHDPALQQALAQASDSAAHKRGDFESRIDAELQSISAAEDRIREAAIIVDRVRDQDFERYPFDGLQAAIERLQTAEQTCESLIDERQAEYVDAPAAGGLTLREYLYEPHDWTYPVVGDALDVIDTVRDVEERLLSIVVDHR
jgi:hypothetical protein